MWPALIILILASVALIVLHFRWRKRFQRFQEEAQFDAEALRKRLEQQTLESQNQQQALFNSMIEGVLLLDEDNRVELANRAFEDLFEISTNVRGKTLLEILRQHELTRLLDQVTVEKQVLDYELKLGGMVERSLQINAAVIADACGDRRGTILVFHDLTRLKQLERNREEFVANVSHELRTPLSLIKGYTETLLDGAKDNPEVATKFLQTIQRNSERLQFLIEDLLTISELESGRLKMNLQKIQLHPLVDKALDDLKAQARTRNVTLLNETPELTVHADAERLHQILGNLVTNAIKYGRADGHIAVRATQSEEMVEVCVQDDGPGIPAEALERVFERFYRVDKARSREQGGTGLGLSIVKHIVLCHGGKVWARSEPGKGAAFYFTIPAND